MFSLPLTRLFDAIRNIGDLQPKCHTRFQVAAVLLLLLLGRLSVIRLVIQGHTFLRRLSVKVHTDRETLVAGVEVEMANNDHGVLCASGLSVRWTHEKKNVERKTLLNRIGMHTCGSANCSELTKKGHSISEGERWEYFFIISLSGSSSLLILAWCKWHCLA